MTRLNETLTELPARRIGGSSPGRAYEKHLVDQDHPRRRQVEAFIARRFLEVHGARISYFMPLLAAIFGVDGEVLAAVGIRDAADAALFLEHYLDAPVERLIVERSGRFMLPPERDAVAEIGNLASVDRRASRKLFALLTEYLSDRGFEWAVFTGCSSLHRMFKNLGIETCALGRALQSRLPADQQTWGSYYEDSPMVVAGRVGQGRRAFVEEAAATMSGSVS